MGFSLLEYIALVSVVIFLITVTMASVGSVMNRKRDTINYDRYVELARQHLSIKDVLSYDTVKYFKVATTACGSKVLTDRGNNVVQLLGEA